MFNQRTKSIRIKPDLPVAGNPSTPTSATTPSTDAKSSSASKSLLYFNPSNFTKLFKNSSNFVQTTFGATSNVQQNPSANHNNNNNNSNSPNHHVQQQHKQAQAPTPISTSYQDSSKTNTANQIVIENGNKAPQFKIPTTKSPTLSSSSLPANASNYYPTSSGTNTGTVIQQQQQQQQKHSEKTLSSPELKKCSTPPITNPSRTYKTAPTPTKTLSAPVLSDPSQKMTNNSSIIFETVKLNKKLSSISNNKLDSSVNTKEMATEFYDDRNNNQCNTEDMHVRYDQDKVAKINRDAKNELHVSSSQSINENKYVNSSKIQSASPIHSQLSRLSNSRPIVTQSLDNNGVQSNKQTVVANSLKNNNISGSSNNSNSLDFNLRECLEQMNANSFIEKSNLNLFHSQDNNGMMKFSQDPIESLYNIPSKIRLPDSAGPDDHIRPTSPNSSSSSSSSSPSSSSSSTSNSPTDNKNNSNFSSNNSTKKVSNSTSNSMYNNILSNYTQTLVVPKPTELDDIKEIDIDEDGNPIYNNTDTHLNWHLRQLNRSTSSFPLSAASFAAASSLPANVPTNNLNPFLQLMANPTALNSITSDKLSIFSSNDNGAAPVSINDNKIFNNTCTAYSLNETNKLFTSSLTSLTSLVNEMAANDVLKDTHFSKIAHPDKMAQSFTNANGMEPSNFEFKVNAGNLNSHFIAPDVMNMLQLYLMEHGNEYIKQFLQVINFIVVCFGSHRKNYVATCECEKKKES